MLHLNRVGGPFSVAFLTGGMHKAFDLIRIRRLLRKGKGADARERAERFVQKTKRARARSVHGHPMSRTDSLVAAGELLYQLGGCSEALELCILPAVEDMMRERDYAGAGLILQEILEVDPGCERAQSLLKRVPAEYR